MTRINQFQIQYNNNISKRYDTYSGHIEMRCTKCNNTGEAMCGPDCKYHNGRGCSDVEGRGIHGCPPCSFCREAEYDRFRAD